MSHLLQDKSTVFELQVKLLFHPASKSYFRDIRWWRGSSAVGRNWRRSGSSPGVRSGLQCWMPCYSDLS